MLMPRLINHMGSQAVHWNHCQPSYLGTVLILPNKGEGLLATCGCLSWARKHLPLHPLSGRISCVTGTPNPPHRWHCFVSQYRVKKRFQVIPPQEPSFSRTGQSYLLSEYRTKFSCQAKLHRQLLHHFHREVTAVVTPLQDGHQNPVSWLAQQQVSSRREKPQDYQLQVSWPPCPPLFPLIANHRVRKNLTQNECI